jgi:hypothetical protein
VGHRRNWAGITEVHGSNAFSYNQSSAPVALRSSKDCHSPHTPVRYLQVSQLQARSVRRRSEGFLPKLNRAFCKDEGSTNLIDQDQLLQPRPSTLILRYKQNMPRFLSVARVHHVYVLPFPPSLSLYMYINNSPTPSLTQW